MDSATKQAAMIEAEQHEEAVDRAFAEGKRRALLNLLGDVMRHLAETGDVPEAAALMAERQGAISVLRDLCAQHGDEDWSDDLHLADIIEKHLGCYLVADGGEDGPNRSDSTRENGRA